VQKHPGGRLARRQLPRIGCRQPPSPKGLGGGPSEGTEANAATVDDTDRKEREDVAPGAPAVEIDKIVDAHDPDEMHGWTATAQDANGVDRVAGADLRLDIGDVDARMPGTRPRRRDAGSERGQFPDILQRISGRHQPPDAVEAKPLHCEQADGTVRRMRRIERAAKQPDAQTGSVGRQNEPRDGRLLALPPRRSRALSVQFREPGI
jgi:hypothetical protein